MSKYFVIQSAVLFIFFKAFACDSCNNFYSNEIGLQCLPCEPGFIAIDDCLENRTRSICEECRDGTFQPGCSRYNKSSSCRRCTMCTFYKEKCTKYRDAVCELSVSGGDAAYFTIALVMCVMLLPLVIIVSFCGLCKAWNKYLMPERETRRIGAKEMSNWQTESRYKKRPNIQKSVEDVIETTDMNSYQTLRHGVMVNEITRAATEKDLRQIAVVHPNKEQKSNDCKEVEHLHDESQNRTAECPLSAADGTSESHINWPKVFSMLATSLPVANWQIFAINLLSNCDKMIKSVQDTVDEITDESRSQHTKGWVSQAYIKVFFKWLNNIGDRNATFEQIEDAVSVITDAEDILVLVRSLKRDPPMTESNPVIQDLTQLKRKYSLARFTNTQQLCVAALHNVDVAPGTSSGSDKMEIRSISSRKLSHQEAHCLLCSAYSSKEISHSQKSLALVQSNKAYIEANSTIYERNTVQQNKSKFKRKKMAQSTNQSSKRIKTEEYIIANAKENLLSDIPIRQNDYNFYMNFVIELIMKTCKVVKRTVLSITYKGFCEAQEVYTNDNEIVFIVAGKPNICLTKQVFEDLTVYGNNARSKLIAFLKTKDDDFDDTLKEKLLFLTFHGKPVLEEMENADKTKAKSFAATHMGSSRHSPARGGVPPSVGLYHDVNELEGFLNDRRPFNQNFSNQSYNFEPNKGDVKRSSNTSGVHESTSNELLGATSKDADYRQEESPLGIENKMITSEREAKEEERYVLDEGNAKELEEIRDLFFPIGDEIYSIENTNSVAEVLERFNDVDFEFNQELTKKP